MSTKLGNYISGVASWKLYLAGAIAAAAVLAYLLFTAYGFGQANIQGKWDQAKLTGLQSAVVEHNKDQAFTDLTGALTVDKEKSRIVLSDDAMKGLEHEIENNATDTVCILSPGRVRSFNAIVRANSR